MKALILAGGGGTRLWPVSRKNKPKQVHPFIDNETLLQKTYARALKAFPARDIFISTSKDQVGAILSQLPSFPVKNLILEPCRRNTAAAIGLAMVKLLKIFPDESVITLNSDHFVKDEEKYLKTIGVAKKLLEQNPDHAVLVGIKPHYPETGYGYIKLKQSHSTVDEHEIFTAEKFVEKPNLETAKNYLASGDYLWNPAMFSWNLKTLYALFKLHLPEIFGSLEKIYAALDTEREEEVTNTEFAGLQSISIDYGIMEKLDKMLVIPADFGWADIGNWCTIKDVLSAKETDNVVKGKHFHMDSEGNLIYSYTNKLIATLGIKDSIIIDTEDVLLVCPKELAQDVRKIVEQLEKEGKHEYL